jgi:hypothetical protein
MGHVSIDDMPEHLASVSPEVYAERKGRPHAPASELAALCLDIMRDGGAVGLASMLRTLAAVSANPIAMRYLLVAMSGDQQVRGASYAERGTVRTRSKQAEHQALEDACAHIAREAGPDVAAKVREFFTPTQKVC